MFTRLSYATTGHILQAELAKLKVDLDEANIAHEGTLAALRQKHNNSMAVMSVNVRVNRAKGYQSRAKRRKKWPFAF